MTTTTSLDDLCDQLARRANELDLSGHWPSEQLALLGEHGVYRWFVSSEDGGVGSDDASILDGYVRLASACLTTAFVLTQRSTACGLIANSENESLRRELLPGLADGSLFATVGFSHLTTSRQHVREPVLRAEATSGGYRINGYAPWVTGASNADVIVTGATLPNGEQFLAAIPGNAPGVEAATFEKLVALSASKTGRVDYHDVDVTADQIVAGPIEQVMTHRKKGGTGGLFTSALAIGLARAATNFLRAESSHRAELEAAARAFATDVEDLRSELLDIAQGRANNAESLRARSNTLALNAAHASLSAAKGTGFVAGHATGRWCREALFFLVWSCPKPVAEANLCELARLGDR
ncbi:acyl-CoA dehydrogenase family protein [Kolteria novifilia]|uniref:acyl-CoA dehydrogenase family protein n=1 Tax=Kolteria novifilia TaxID=2527975 RepID=UPI003AF3CA11